MHNNKGIEYDYIVGAEKNIKEILKGADVMPLFESAVRSGVSYIALEDDNEKILYRYGAISENDCLISRKPVYLEGEAAAYIVIMGDYQKKDFLNAASEMIYDSLNVILKSNFKSLLAAETHKAVVHQSYEELLDINRQLKLSENKYRELAGSLEKQVRQRTEELKKAHAKLLHQEKIASVGQLAAGVAHEINNPLGFILSNVNILKQYFTKMKDMLAFYRGAFEKKALTDNDRDAAEAMWIKYKLSFISTDIEDLIRESVDGAERVKKIVSDLKGFSHIDEAKESDVDVNKELDRTLNVLSHEIPADAEIIKEYQPLPLFYGKPQDICQAFFNIVLNALQAGKEGLKLVIRTQYADEGIRIDFSDNGPGIPNDIRNRIFEPFFTTKEVGKGTGMGLNVTYEIINSYGGTIEVQSEPGKGTTFSILLPVAGKSAEMKC